MKNLLIVLLLGLVGFLLVGLAHERWGVGAFFDGMDGVGHGRAKRLAAAAADRAKDKPIVIGLVGPEDDPEHRSMTLGIELARELRNRGGGVVGRQLAILFRDDRAEVEACKHAIQDFAANPEVVAVIGGFYLRQLVAIEPLCEFNRMPLVAPALASGIFPEANQFRYSLVCMPDISTFAQAMLRFVGRRPNPSIGVISPPEYEYGYYFANALEAALARKSLPGVSVAGREIIYNPRDTGTINKFFAQWQADEAPGHFFIGGYEDKAAATFAAAGKAGVKSAFLLCDDVETAKLANIPGIEDLQIFLPSVYDPDNDKPAAVEFRREFRARHGADPDAWAALGYDAFNLIAAAIAQAGSSVPEVFIDTLLNIEFEGNVTIHPRISFDANGNLNSGKAIIKTLKDGKFVVVTEPSE